MRLLHSADWQLGKSFKQFGEKANELRQARFETLPAEENVTVP